MYTMIVKNKNRSFRIENLDDMVSICNRENRAFGYQQDLFYSTEFNFRIKTDPKFINCFEAISNTVPNFDKTKNDRILGFFELAFPLTYTINNDSDYMGLALHKYILSKSSSFFGVSKKGVDIKDVVKLYAAYEKLISNGTLQRIRNEWGDKVFGEHSPWDNGGEH